MSSRFVSPVSFGTLVAIKRFNKPVVVKAQGSADGPLYLDNNPAAVVKALDQLVQPDRLCLDTLPHQSGEFGGRVDKKTLPNGNIQVTLRVKAPTPKLEKCVAEEILGIPASKRQEDGTRIHPKWHGWFFLLDSPRKKQDKPIPTGMVRALRAYPTGFSDRLQAWIQNNAIRFASIGNRYFNTPLLNIPPFELKDPLFAASVMAHRVPLPCQRALESVDSPEQTAPVLKGDLPSNLASVTLIEVPGQSFVSLDLQSLRNNPLHPWIILGHLLGIKPGQRDTVPKLQRHGWMVLGEINPTDHVYPDLLPRFFGVEPNPKVVPFHGKDRILASAPHPVPPPEKPIDKKTMRRTLRENTAAIQNGKVPPQQTPYYYTEPKIKHTFSPKP